MYELSLLQWPAMICTLTAAWFVTSRRSRRRHAGFWLFLFSNALWMAWGVSVHADTFVVLQICLGMVNIRGLHKTADNEGPRVVAGSCTVIEGHGHGKR